MIETVVAFLAIVCLLLLLKLATGPKILTVHVDGHWFTGIMDGLKTVEAIPGDFVAMTEISGTKYIRFQNGNRRMLCKLLNVKMFHSLKEYVLSVGWQNCAPHARSYDHAISEYLKITNPQGISPYSSKRIEECGGLVALVFELV